MMRAVDSVITDAWQSDPNQHKHAASWADGTGSWRAIVGVPQLGKSNFAQLLANADAREGASGLVRFTP